jgi:protein NirF
MRKIITGLVLAGIMFTTFTMAKEKYFVVERESESLAIIEDGLTKRHMKNMHNMNHGIVKFDKDDA